MVLKDADCGLQYQIGDEQTAMDGKVSKTHCEGTIAKQGYEFRPLNAQLHLQQDGTGGSNANCHTIHSRSFTRALRLRFAVYEQLRLGKRAAFGSLLASHSGTTSEDSGTAIHDG